MAEFEGTRGEVRHCTTLDDVVTVRIRQSFNWLAWTLAQSFSVSRLPVPKRVCLTPDRGGFGQRVLFKGLSTWIVKGHQAALKPTLRRHRLPKQGVAERPSKQGLERAPDALRQLA